MLTEVGLNTNYNLEHLQGFYKITLLKEKLTSDNLNTILLEGDSFHCDVQSTKSIFIDFAK